MELLYLVGTIWSILLISFAMCLDTRRPMSTKLKYKYKVKDDSIFRKIIKFKDKEHYPCNYFKIVPFYVFLVLAILSLILLLVDIFANGVITNVVSAKVFIITMLCVFGISIIYFLFFFSEFKLVIINNFPPNSNNKKVYNTNTKNA